MADAVKRGRIVLVREVRELLGKALAFKVVFLRGEDMEPVIQNPSAPDSTGMISAPKCVSRFPGMPCKAGRFADFIFRNRQTGEQGKRYITKDLL